ncbi:MAG: GIY-YIG nuclease family protein [Candidatus Daviesbacteria bacterium]|nr:GIY-YIG nuclease family protein [Candidatus Daviesbacteria bacterium]
MLTKEDILKEIRRTTKENGGTPLGISRFKDETGINDTEWQRHWPRFNDAKREAGVKATPFIRPAFSDERVFEQFILLTRELERVPVAGELIVKHTQDSNFSSVAVFQRLFSRLGGKRKFLTELLKYAENKNYMDIVKLCRAYLKKVKTVEIGEEDTLENESFGYVYLGKRGKHYRIGRAKDLDQRRNDHNLNQPEYFEYIHVIKTDDPVNIEDYWHKRFASKMFTGEWFKLNSSDVKAFKRWRRIF